MGSVLHVLIGVTPFSIVTFLAEIFYALRIYLLSKSSRIPIVVCMVRIFLQCLVADLYLCGSYEPSKLIARISSSRRLDLIRNSLERSTPVQSSPQNCSDNYIHSTSLHISLEC